MDYEMPTDYLNPYFHSILCSVAAVMENPKGPNRKERRKRKSLEKSKKPLDEGTYIT